MIMESFPPSPGQENPLSRENVGESGDGGNRTHATIPPSRRVLIVAAHYAPDGDTNQHLDALADALAPLKRPGTYGSAVAYDLDKPANEGLVDALADALSLTPEDVAEWSDAS